MEMLLARRPGDAARSLWVVAAGILIAGYLLINHRYESSIRASLAHSAQLAREIAAERAAIDRTAIYKRLETRARRDLRHLVQRPQPFATAATLQEVALLARRFGIGINSIATENRPATAKDKSQPSAVPLVMRLHGTFPSLLSFIQALPRQGTPVAIDDIDLQAQAQLVATVHATLYRIVIPNV